MSPTVVNINVQIGTIGEAMQEICVRLDIWQ